MRHVQKLAWFLSIGLVVAMGGCGSDGSSGGTWGQTEHQFVMTSLEMPWTAAASTRLGYDYDGDGVEDNRLGEMLVALQSVFPAEAQQAIDDQLMDGSVVHLMSVYADDPANAGDAAVWQFLGQPETITGGVTPGTEFTVDTAAGSNFMTYGAISNGLGVFASETGEIKMTMPLTSTAKVTVTLKQPTLEFDISADGQTITNGRISGIVPEAELETKLVPALDDQLARTCSMSTGSCVCDGPGGDAIRDLLDSDGDCSITLAEAQANALLTNLLAGDIDLGGGTMGLSVGVGFTAIAATYTHAAPPAE